MSVSLDGYISRPRGEIDWSAPDTELFRFHTERVREIDLQLLGRRLYETMTYWETFEERSIVIGSMRRRVGFQLSDEIEQAAGMQGRWRQQRSRAEADSRSGHAA